MNYTRAKGRSNNGYRRDQGGKRPGRGRARVSKTGLVETTRSANAVMEELDKTFRRDHSGCGLQRVVVELLR